MTAVFWGDAADRSAATWKGSLEPDSRLEFVVSDAAKGTNSAVEQRAEARRWNPAALALEQRSPIPIGFL